MDDLTDYRARQRARYEQQQREQEEQRRKEEEESRQKEEAEREQREKEERERADEEFARRLFAEEAGGAPNQTLPGPAPVDVDGDDSEAVARRLQEQLDAEGDGVRAPDRHYEQQLIGGPPQQGDFDMPSPGYTGMGGMLSGAMHAVGGALFGQQQPPPAAAAEGPIDVDAEIAAQLARQMTDTSVRGGDGSGAGVQAGEGEGGMDADVDAENAILRGGAVGGPAMPPPSAPPDDELSRGFGVVPPAAGGSRPSVGAAAQVEGSLPIDVDSAPSSGAGGGAAGAPPTGEGAAPTGGDVEDMEGLDDEEIARRLQKQFEEEAERARNRSSVGSNTGAGGGAGAQGAQPPGSAFAVGNNADADAALQAAIAASLTEQ
uniref:Uncharacterized protein n=1 Tax=Chromera velia CCMP2878 TaxID=1169474 RepID=A0A0G4HHE8_9ALVE|eukprot:Cvel_27610.t1-p1 / transcript=Cvel_27610.t1 / gene=Cvel_27610 / organism=Chromera_velia_CCMP2878 / gene_product=hypothetical protein / transcript_product=hypothetical protein / location=Cvel_scaffold3473:13450-14887(+) / protein_length=374 / sequence_SO=supercontig / SO=protein_coding / is_pseudo=false